MSSRALAYLTQQHVSVPWGGFDSEISLTIRRYDDPALIVPLPIYLQRGYS